MSIAVSVVLPTYNRKEMLKLVLDSLENQTFQLEKFEVVVSDDGSSDGTQEFLIEYSKKNVLQFNYILAAENGGPAKARNSALAVAKGEVIIIIGDDIVVGETFVQQHFDWHCEHGEISDAVLGFVTWPESIKASMFMKWLETGGRSFFFKYADFQSGHSIESQYFYTCNISLKSSLLFKTSLFDESFPFASHEDIELGERLRLEGMSLFFEKDIVGYHYHYLHIEGIAKRVYLMGYSANIYWKKVSDHSSLLKKITRAILRQVFSFPLAWPLLIKLLKLETGIEENSPLRWKSILIISYWLGLADSWSNKNVRTFPELYQSSPNVDNNK